MLINVKSIILRGKTNGDKELLNANIISAIERGELYKSLGFQLAGFLDKKQVILIRNSQMEQNRTRGVPKDNTHYAQVQQSSSEVFNCYNAIAKDHHQSA